MQNSLPFLGNKVEKNGKEAFLEWGIQPRNLEIFYEGKLYYDLLDNSVEN